MKLENLCPVCGSHLTLREGEYGEFLACPRFPECRYTKSLEGGVEYKIYKPPSKFCKSCNHTGLIPFKKNGKIIPYAWVDCECKQPEVEHYTPITAEDFDFPCSYDQRAYYEEYFYGRELPPIEIPKPKYPQPYPEHSVIESIITAKHHYIGPWTTKEQVKGVQPKGVPL